MWSLSVAWEGESEGSFVSLGLKGVFSLGFSALASLTFSVRGLLRGPTRTPEGSL